MTVQRWLVTAAFSSILHVFTENPRSWHFATILCLSYRLGTKHPPLHDFQALQKIVPDAESLPRARTADQKGTVMNESTRVALFHQYVDTPLHVSSVLDNVTLQNFIKLEELWQWLKYPQRKTRRKQQQG